MIGKYHSFVAWRYLLDPPPRRLSDVLLVVLALIGLVYAFSTLHMPWLAFGPPFAYGNVPPPPVSLGATFWAATVPTTIFFALVFGPLRGGSWRTSTIALWWAFAGALLALSGMGVLAVSMAPGGTSDAWMEPRALIGLGAAVEVALFALMAHLRKWRSGRWALLAAVLAGAISLNFGAKALVSWVPLSKAATWPVLVLAGVGVLAVLVGGLGWIRSRNNRRRAEIAAFVLAAGAAVLGVAGLMVGLRILDAVGAPTYDLLGLTPDSARPIWLVLMERAGIVLGSFVAALIAVRYFFSFFTSVSIGGVLLGTMAPVMVLSVMNGFENDLRAKILGSNAHILVSKPDGDFTEYREIAKLIANIHGIVGQSPFLISEVVVSSRRNHGSAVIKGVDPQSVGSVSKLADDIEQKYLDRPLERLYPLSSDGSVLGLPTHDSSLDNGGGKAGADVVDPAPDDYDIPDFDPLDLSGGMAPDEPAHTESDGATLKETDTAGLDPIAQARHRDGGGLGSVADGGSVGDLGGDDSGVEGWLGFDGGVPPLMHHTGIELGLGQVPPIPPDIAVLPGIMAGRELSNQLLLSVGDEITVVSPINQDTPLGPVPRTKRYRVAATFYSGMYDYDLKYVYVELETLQQFLDLGDQVNGIEIRVTDPTRTGVIVEQLQAALPSDLLVQDWRELNRSLFSALLLEKVVMFMVLAIVILVASFSIVGNLIMVVVEKSREIAVLKTLGTSDRGILRIFIAQGLCIGVVGTVLGVGLGVYHAAITLTSFPIPAAVFYIDSLPIHLEGWPVVLVAAAGMLISVAATIYPAHIASRQDPVEGLTYE